jgi:dCMP deaminase
MGVAELFAERSTCSRLHVGAVFSRDGRILVTGYNGAPKGLPHCDHVCVCSGEAVEVRVIGRNAEGQTKVQMVDCISVDGRWHAKDCTAITPCTTAEHAERNAIAWAARHGVKLEGCEVHVTHMPCLPCAMALVNAGVQRVTFQHEYRIHDGVELLRAAGIEVLGYPEVDMI